MTMRKLEALTLAAPLLLLAACGDDTEVSTGDDGREASGEVLEGSISDAMLPVDDVRSQAPLRAPDPQAPVSGGGTTPAEGDEVAADETVAPAPAQAVEEPAE